MAPLLKGNIARKPLNHYKGTMQACTWDSFSAKKKDMSRNAKPQMLVQYFKRNLAAWARRGQIVTCSSLLSKSRNGPKYKGRWTDQLFFRQWQVHQKKMFWRAKQPPQRKLYNTKTELMIRHTSTLRAWWDFSVLNWCSEMTASQTERNCGFFEIYSYNWLCSETGVGKVHHTVVAACRASNTGLSTH